jgi:hypothetical protein
MISKEMLAPLAITDVGAVEAIAHRLEAAGCRNSPIEIAPLLVLKFKVLLSITPPLCLSLPHQLSFSI